MWEAVGWACSLVGLACSSVPNVAVIQTAYEREAAAGSKLHDKDLLVLAAKCHDNSGRPFLCEVTFISNKDPNKGMSASISTSLPSLVRPMVGSSRAACARERSRD